MHGSGLSLGSKPLLPHGAAHFELFSRRDAVKKERQNQVRTHVLLCPTLTLFSLRKMIDLVTSIRDISDTLPSLSGGVPGSVVEIEPDLTVFSSEAPGVRHTRIGFRLGNRRSRLPWMGGGPAGPARAINDIYRHQPMMNPFMPPGYYSDDSDSSDYYHGGYFHDPFDSDDCSDSDM